MRDQELIDRVARHMLAKHSANAMRCAELRALDLRNHEPGASARWRLVAQAIGLKSRPGIEPWAA